MSVRGPFYTHRRRVFSASKLLHQTRFWLGVAAITTGMVSTLRATDAKPRIAVFSGPTATIQNNEPLVTSNKAREQYGLPVRHDAHGQVLMDWPRVQRIARAPGAEGHQRERGARGRFRENRRSIQASERKSWRGGGRAVTDSIITKWIARTFVGLLALAFISFWCGRSVFIYAGERTPAKTFSWRDAR